MFKKFKKGEGGRGFTLIELLVVIAIIGILSSVVLASLNTARKKSRDARRLSDIKQLQMALEMYFDSQSVGAYPVTGTGSDQGLNALVSSNFLPSLPKDPSTGFDYKYCGGGTTYHLGAIMEDPKNPALSSDQDIALGTNCAAADDFEGASPDCGSTTGTDQCYDVAP